MFNMFFSVSLQTNCAFILSELLGRIFFSGWKECMETKALKIMKKTRILVSECGAGSVRSSGKWPYSVVGKGLIATIFCVLCKHWVHKRCNGMKGRLRCVTYYKCTGEVRPLAGHQQNCK